MKNEALFSAVQKASRDLVKLEVETINKVLLRIAEKTEAEIDFLLHENAKDLARMEESNPKFDRLKLTEKRIRDIVSDIKNVASLPYPVGKILETKKLPNGLSINKISVPIGVIGIIYEARPNVTFDCFALSLKSGNATILKGGSDAEFSNNAIVSFIHSVLKEFGINENIVHLLGTDRESTTELLQAVKYVDIIIPRGSQNLINYVRDNAKVPIIETGAGIVHAYFDEEGDLEKGKNIINNAKTRRVSVCNALDCLIIHQSRIKDLSSLVNPLINSKVELFADENSYEELQKSYPKELLKKATDESFGIEFLDYKMSVKSVNSIDEAIEHIANHSSKHSEVIITENKNNIAYFFKVVDAAALYANASTAFTDGAQFGMGAEIGISTQKLHARGPMALPELTSYKWLIEGNGQIRN
jgi:glutamate-5-semialdehyde dehydrogenase